MIATFLTIAAALVTIIMFFSHSQERIARLEEHRENIVDKLENKIEELERKVHEQNCRIAWLEGFIDSYSKSVKLNKCLYIEKEEKK